MGIFFSSTDNDTDKGTYGIAFAHFHINESPYLGSCNIKPLKGIEMRTSFSAFCYEWKDEVSTPMFQVPNNNLNKYPQLKMFPWLLLSM